MTGVQTCALPIYKHAKCARTYVFTISLDFWKSSLTYFCRDRRRRRFWYYLSGIGEWVRRLKGGWYMIYFQCIVLTSSTVSDPISLYDFSFLLSFVSRPFFRDSVSWCWRSSYDRERGIIDGRNQREESVTCLIRTHPLLLYIYAFIIFIRLFHVASASMKGSTPLSVSPGCLRDKTITRQIKTDA